jgi:hypothetical protein
MKENNTGFYVVIGIAVVGGLGYWAYTKYIKPKVKLGLSLTSGF